MKKKIPISLIPLCLSIVLGLLPLFALAQNALPQISNLAINLDTVARQLTVTYDVADTDNDTLLIRLRVSDNGGNTFWVDVADSDLSGDVLYPVSTGNGKQLIWHYPNTFAGPADIRIKLIADDLQPIDIQSLVNQIDSNRLWSDLQFIQGIRHYTTGNAHINEVKDSIEARFLAANLQTHRQTFSFLGNNNAQNIVGNRAGQANETQVCIVDAHFDSVSNAPGADDNGSGVVGVLEAARILAPYNYERSLRFIGFDLEESGLVGSLKYLNQGGLQPAETISGVLNFEMIGYYTNQPNSQTVPFGFDLLYPDLYAQLQADQFRGNFLINIANTNSDPLRLLFDSCATVYIPELKIMSFAIPGNGEIAPDMRRSDHAPFWDAGYHALMLTDGANFRNLNYHTATDNIGTINLQFLTQNVKATVATAAHLAGIRHSSETIGQVNTTITAIGQQPKPSCVMTLSPNPAQAQISELYFGDCAKTGWWTIKIFDTTGKILQEKQHLLTANNRKNILDISQLPQGTYYVSAAQNNAHNTQITRLLIIY